MMKHLLLLLGVWWAVSGSAGAATPRPRAGIRLEDFPYPFPVALFRFESQQQELEMAYMELAPAGTPRGTVVLLHGKNFSGSYWADTARALLAEGYRVIMPDQIGFGKSSKPDAYQFTFQQLAANTRALLQHLGIRRAHLLGHSMGGMVATRYALMYPEDLESLVLVNPIGLEDWAAKGVPYQPIDATYREELAKTVDKVRAYQRDSYYDGHWREAYEPWVEMLASFFRSPDYPRMAWNQALTTDMIFTQPVCYEFGRLQMPVLLLIGQRDRTAIGRPLAPVDVRSQLGNYPELGRQAARAIPRATLVELDGLGHLPHIEAFSRFIAPLQAFLAQPAR